jgi:threonine dehydratase
VSVTESEIESAMAFAARRLRIVAEPGGAVALAALLAGKAGPATARTVVVISGGNVDPALYAAVLAAQAAETER